MKIKIILSICVLLLSGCNNEAISQQLLTEWQKCIKEEIKSEKYKFISNTAFSYDGSSFAFIAVDADAKTIIIKDGNVFDEYDYYVDNLGYFWNSQSFIYLVMDRTLRKYYIVENGVDGRMYEGIDGITYSPFRDSLAYRAYTGEKYIIVKDGIEINKYDTVSEPRYSMNGELFGFIAEINGEQILVENGVEMYGYTKIWWLKGTDYWEWYIYRATKDGKDILVIGWVEVDAKKYYSWSASLSLDRNKEWNIFKEKKGDKWVVIQNGVESNEYDEIRGSFHSLSNNNFIFIAKKDDKTIVVQNNVEIQQYNYDEIHSIVVFSPNAESHAFLVQKGDKWIVVKDGVESSKYDWVSGLLYSGNNKKFSYQVYENDDNGYIENTYTVQQENCPMK